MNARKTIIQMLRQLLKEMEIVSSQGAGYYTTVPFARRYNKLLEAARKALSDSNPIVETFEDIDETDPRDPSEKGNKLLGIRVEISQLISLLESSLEMETQ